jgi:hypothetical protein
MPPKHSQIKTQERSSKLTYYIFEGILAGLVAGKPIELSALSGGGGGSTKYAAADTVNNPYSTGVKTTGSGSHHVHGGPIPQGAYKICAPAHHPHLGLSARLDPEESKTLVRGGFFIHGRGPHGSDGCIVPLDHKKFRELMTGLSVSRGGSLLVAESMSGDRFA